MKSGTRPVSVLSSFDTLLYACRGLYSRFVGRKGVAEACRKSAMSCANEVVCRRWVTQARVFGSGCLSRVARAQRVGEIDDRLLEKGPFD